VTTLIAPFSEGSGTTDDLFPVPSQPQVSLGTGRTRCQTVNVGGDSAVTRVTVTGDDVDDIIVTARKLASLPDGVISPGMPVYQYIDIVPARYKVISGALIEFDLPFFQYQSNGE
jgi:hypothetical protein